MNTEKTITLQAKNSLKNNWTVLITALLFIFASVLAISVLQSLILIAMRWVDTTTGDPKSGRELYVNISDIVFIAVLYLISPLVNGFFKMVYTTANNYKPEFYELFFYFKGFSRYFKTLFLNLFFFIIILFCAFAFDFGYVVNLIIDSLFNGSEEIGAVITEGIFNIFFMGISFILSSFMYLLFINYSAFMYADNCNKGVFSCIGKGIAMGFKNFANSLKLFFRFIGWFTLCFFIIPALYVLPYISATFATSAKWLISLEKGRVSL